MGNPYSEKLWPKSWKLEGSIFQNESQFFTIRKDPKPANKLFTFPSFSEIVFTLVKHFHKQRVHVTVTVRKSVQRYEPTRLHDWLLFPPEEKGNSGIISYLWTNSRYNLWEVISTQSRSSVWTIAQIDTDVYLDRPFFTIRWTIYSFYSDAFYLNWGFRRIWKREELTPLLLSHQTNSINAIS